MVKQNRILCADNGNLNEIEALIEHFIIKTASLQVARAQEEKRLGRYARPGDLSEPLTQQFRKAAADIEKAAKAAVDHRSMRVTIASQGATKANYMIGMEDFTISTLTGCGIEPEYSRLPLSWYRRPTERAVKLAIQSRDGAFGNLSPLIFAGLHAIDYDTALQAGKLAAQAGVDGLATGLAGVLADRNHVDFRVKNKKLIALPGTAARPYLRSAEIVAGMHVGYAQIADRRPRFHGLGAGTPIMLPLLAMLSDKRTFMAIDSMAPILDAWSSKTISLYIDRPAALKLKAHLIAEHWMEEGLGWDCSCPYCRRFNSAHPPKLAKAKKWWAAEGKRKLKPSDMHSPSPLAEPLPFLANPLDPALRRKAGLARVGHNHWVLQRLQRNIRSRAGSRRRLREWVAQQVDDYVDTSASPPWKAATKAAFDVVDEAARELADVPSGGSV